MATYLATKKNNGAWKALYEEHASGNRTQTKLLNFIIRHLVQPHTHGYTNTCTPPPHTHTHVFSRCQGLLSNILKNLAASVYGSTRHWHKDHTKSCCSSTAAGTCTLYWVLHDTPPRAPVPSATCFAVFMVFCSSLFST